MLLDVSIMSKIQLMIELEKKRGISMVRKKDPARRN
jgi:hypothetical protein